MYFNHFIKLRDRRVIKREYLWRLIVRGAAGICVDCQDGIDIIIPFLYRDDTLQSNDVSALFIQSKNDPSFRDKPR